MISDICLKALTVQYELWYLENLYQQAISVQPELCYLCQHALTIHYNLWYLISVNRLSQYSINYHWYLKSVNRHSQYSRQLHSQKWAWSGQHGQCGRDNHRQWDPRPGIRPRDVTGGWKLPGGGGRWVMIFIRLNVCLYFA